MSDSDAKVIVAISLADLDRALSLMSYCAAREMGMDWTEYRAFRRPLEKHMVHQDDLVEIRIRIHLPIA